MQDTYYLGLDIGSVAVKLAIADENRQVVLFDSQRITSNPTAAVNLLLTRLGSRLNLESIIAAGVSGSGKSVVPEELKWADYSSPLATAAGLLHYYPDGRSVIQIGGQSSLVIRLEDGLKKPWQVASNPLCAAGTGRFLEQQAYRLGVSLDDLSRLALGCQSSPPRVAARCSVFAKTDLIHLQQKGTPVESMLYGLCQSVARMVVSLQKGTFDEPVYFVGGVAANGAIARALADALSSRNGHEVEVIVPEDYLYIEALGSALLSRGKSSPVVELPETDGLRRHFALPGLEQVSIQDSCPDYRAEVKGVGYLGVDVGSTSTKAVIVDPAGRVMAKSYLMTAGRPLEAVKKVFRNLVGDGAGGVNIAGVGVTGSGRYLAGGFIGSDLIRDEITAQTRAAAEIDIEADIIEIGGQDSKLIIKRNGVVVDYQMNKACAAGTGSFIDELAEMLGVSVSNGDFARLAFAAPYTIDLGTRCAAFTAQAVASAQQEGVPLEVIIASLANTIAENYLSKVVAGRKLGSKVILTGAVFYNQAVVSAFHRQLKDRRLIVAEHREVSGAIGAALLAREEAPGRESNFRGFNEVIDGNYSLDTFTCQGCENNCAITRMQLSGGKAVFYGSRCDRYNSDDHSQMPEESPFTEREKVLFRGYREDRGNGPLVGIPRSLMVYDYAPLLIGFLNALGARVVLSGKTTAETIKQAAQLSYSDSCFPLKLLYGHTSRLGGTDYILYPCAIRLGKREGDENQKYACPLVQASPFIVHQALGLGERLLVPVIDFSRGNGKTVNSLADAAVKMGFSRSKGRLAALTGIKAQQTFEAERAVLGERLLAKLRCDGGLGVVIFSRSYMSQDSGANLGVAEILSRLGVVPIPLDFLPLESVDVRQYSDRPYWFYESKYIAAAAITAREPKLFGLMVTNFGCGPNSFMAKIVEDIMDGKPLGQIEIDEHAAEAGIVTRLEAFVNTIRGFTASPGESKVPGRYIYRGAAPLDGSKKTLIAPRMSPHIEAVAAAMVAYGRKVEVLPEPDQKSLIYSDQVTSGAECLPFRITLGDFMRFYYENGAHPKDVEGFTGGAYGPCRFGKYAIEQARALKQIGFDLKIRTTVSNSAYHDVNLGPGFERLAWRGIVAVDCLQRLLWRSRPYEREPGSADGLFAEYKRGLLDCIGNKGYVRDLLKQATADFQALIDPELPRRPLVGINGEVYLRNNRFSNKDLVRVCEAAGLEVIVSPLGEWLKYVYHRNFEDAVSSWSLKRMLAGYVKKLVLEHDEHLVASRCHGFLDVSEPRTVDILARTGSYLSPRCGSEAVLSIGSGLTWMQDYRFAGVISVMPHGCMPGGIVAAMSERFSAMHHKPWISLTYDGFPETNNLTRINNFAEIIRYCNQESRVQGNPATELTI